MDKKKFGLLWAISCVLAGIVGIVVLVDIVLCGGYGKGHEPAEGVRDTVIDTIPYYKPVPKDSLLLTYKTVTLPLPKSDKTQPSIRADTRQKESCIQDNVADVRDSAEVTIPIIQKMYNGGDYTAWVSGYDVQLDSIYVYPKHEYVTRKIKQPPKKWHVGVTAGYGFGKQGMQPYIGIGLTYSLISF